MSMFSILQSFVRDGTISLQHSYKRRLHVHIYRVYVIVSVRRFSGFFSLVKDLKCTCATPESSVDAKLSAQEEVRMHLLRYRKHNHALSGFRRE